MFIDFRERGREGEKERGREGEKERGRERETSMLEKHQYVVSRTCPDQGSNPQPGYVP